MNYNSKGDYFPLYEFNESMAKMAKILEAARESLKKKRGLSPGLKPLDFSKRKGLAPELRA